ncbi:hypothetical protein [Streptomyces bauhiniae]|uniref:hypothetical protein n=1 Tax=Streptomyces bauhiniae TaxID=2340725 RepID=UPI0035E3464A
MVHPRHWPENLDFTGKQVLVIGSGATAVTLIPAMTPPSTCRPSARRGSRWTGARSSCPASPTWS